MYLGTGTDKLQNILHILHIFWCVSASVWCEYCGFVKLVVLGVQQNKGKKRKRNKKML
jgi:hypothetical protein